MKKTYINPVMRIHTTKAKQRLLAGSDPVLGTSYTGGTILSRDADIEEEEDY